MHGAVQESEHIFINYGFNFCKADPVRIFEVGFGTGLNALLTAVNTFEGKRKVIYTSAEKYPLESELAGQLNHSSFISGEGKKLSDLITAAAWNDFTEISANFILKKMHCDVVRDNIPGEYDLIYFDAFGPDKQPEMWTGEIFRKISAVTVSGGIFVTYASKGQVKRELRDSGFRVELLPGPPGKRHIIRAIKI